MKIDKEKKTTSEKPVSLAPLDLGEALGALLKLSRNPKRSHLKSANLKNKKSPAVKLGFYFSTKIVIVASITLSNFSFFNIPTE